MGICFHFNPTTAGECNLPVALPGFCQLQIVSVSVWYLKFWELYRGCTNAKALRGGVTVAVGGCLVIGCCWLLSSSHVKRNEKRLDILMVNINLAPRTVLSPYTRKSSWWQVLPAFGLQLHGGRLLTSDTPLLAYWQREGQCVVDLEEVSSMEENVIE